MLSYSMERTLDSNDRFTVTIYPDKMSESLTLEYYKLHNGKIELSLYFKHFLTNETWLTEKDIKNIVDISYETDQSKSQHGLIYHLVISVKKKERLG